VRYEHCEAPAGLELVNKWIWQQYKIQIYIYAGMSNLGRNPKDMKALDKPGIVFVENVYILERNLKDNIRILLDQLRIQFHSL